MSTSEHEFVVDVGVIRRNESGLPVFRAVLKQKNLPDRPMFSVSFESPRRGDDDPMGSYGAIQAAVNEWIEKEFPFVTAYTVKTVYDGDESLPKKSAQDLQTIGEMEARLNRLQYEIVIGVAANAKVSAEKSLKIPSDVFDMIKAYDASTDVFELFKAYRGAVEDSVYFHLGWNRTVGDAEIDQARHSIESNFQYICDNADAPDSLRIGLHHYAESLRRLYRLSYNRFRFPQQVPMDQTVDDSILDGLDDGFAEFSKAIDESPATEPSEVVAEVLGALHAERVKNTDLTERCIQFESRAITAETALAQKTAEAMQAQGNYKSVCNELGASRQERSAMVDVAGEVAETAHLAVNPYNAARNYLHYLLWHKMQPIFRNVDGDGVLTIAERQTRVIGRRSGDRPRDLQELFYFIDGLVDYSDIIEEYPGLTYADISAAKNYICGLTEFLAMPTVSTETNEDKTD